MASAREEASNSQGWLWGLCRSWPLTLAGRTPLVQVLSSHLHYPVAVRDPR